MNTGMTMCQNEHWYDHVPESVERSHQVKVTILSSQQVQTDRNIPNNKTDTIIRDNEEGTCVLIDNVISEDRNVIKKEAENILNNKNLTIKIEFMWTIKIKGIPIITGANGPWRKDKVVRTSFVIFTSIRSCKLLSDTFSKPRDLRFSQWCY